MPSENTPAHRTKVAWFATGWAPEVGGPTTGNMDRARRLLARPDIELTIFAPQSPTDDAVAGTPEDPQLEQVVRRYPAKPWPIYPGFRVPTLRGARQVERELAELNPDVVVNLDLERGALLSGWRLPGRREARRSGAAYLGYFHTDFYGFAGRYRGWRHVRDIVLRPILRWLYGRPDLMVTASPGATATLRELGVCNVHEMRFDGVDTEVFRPDLRDRAALGQSHPGLGTEGRVVLSLGRMAPEKRIDLTIEAFGLLQADPSFDDVRLLVVGDGPERLRERLHRQAGALADPSRVVFTGFVHGQAKRQLMASVDAYCLPSPHETFSITTTELMASGVPVVVDRSCAVTAYVDDGVNGFLHDSGSAPDIARGLRDALTCDRDTVGSAARRTVEQRYSMRAIGEALADLMHAVSTLPSRPSTNPAPDTEQVAAA